MVLINIVKLPTDGGRRNGRRLCPTRRPNIVVILETICAQNLKRLLSGFREKGGRILTLLRIGIVRKVDNVWFAVLLREQVKFCWYFFVFNVQIIMTKIFYKLPNKGNIASPIKFNKYIRKNS